MKTYTTLRNLYGSLTNDTGATNLTLGDQLINDGIREFAGAVPGYYLYDTQDITMIADTQFYDLKNDFKKLRAVKKVIGSQVYVPKEISSLTKWDWLNRSATSSNIPEIGFYPTPSDTETATVYYHKKFKDLSVADITSSTIATATNGSKDIIASGGLVADMVGRYLRITTPTGDGLWYKIATFTDATHITLDKNYQGTSITGGTAACIIGEMPIIPEAYHIAPVHYAVAQYWQMNGEPVRAREYERRYAELIARAKTDINSLTTSPVIDDGRIDIINPNLTVSL